MASCRGIFAKFVLCLVNLIFLIMALSVIMLGARMQMVRDSHNDVVLEAFRWKSLSTFFIFLGFILGVISVFGFTAAICESPTLLNVYVYFLALCMTALIVLHCAMIYFKPQLVDEAKTYFKKLMSKFHENVDARYIVHKVHANFYCCGLVSVSDWRNESLLMLMGNHSSSDYSNSDNSDFGSQEVGFPISCCDKDTTLAGNDSEQTCPETELVHMDGCFSKVQISRYAFFFRAVFAITILLMLLLLTMACCLERDRMLQMSQIINLQYAAHLTSCRTQQQQQQSAVNAKPGVEYPMLGFEPLYGKRPSNLADSKLNPAQPPRSTTGSQCQLPALPPPSQFSSSSSSRRPSQQLPPPPPSQSQQQLMPVPQQQQSQSQQPQASIIYQPMPSISGYQSSNISFQPQPLPSYQSQGPVAPSQQAQPPQASQSNTGFGIQQPSSLQSQSIRTSVLTANRSYQQQQDPSQSQSQQQSMQMVPQLQLQPQSHHSSMQQMRYI